MRWSSMTVLALIAPVTIAGCIDAIPTQVTSVKSVNTTLASVQPRHLVVFEQETLPGDLEARVTALGGTVEAVHHGIGAATLSGVSDDAALQLAAADDVQAVEPVLFVSLEGEKFDPHPIDDEGIATADVGIQAAPPTSAQFYARQWNMRAIQAPEAWAAGHLGSADVVVGLIDSGLDYLHPDFDGLVDLSRSISFVPEDDPIIAAHFPGRLPITDLGYHGTAVGSVIATNGLILAGVSQRVTYVVVKAFNQNLTGTLDRTIQAIMYAADQGVDVINLSAAFSFNKDESPGSIAAFQRAVNYAFRKGALIIAPPGNDAADLQHNGNRVRLPCEAAHVLCVSATGPTAAGSLTGPWTNVDAIAPYSAFGRSAITVAAPGGAGNVGSGRRLFVLCSRTAIGAGAAPACRAGQPLAQPAATSFSAPHVTGLAALLIAQNGKGKPAQIRSMILQTADDLGEPGVDAFYGHGRINVARALGIQ